MYHKIEDQEKHPEKYYLKEIDGSTAEDECFDFLSLPRQTQRTIGLYLKKIKDTDDSPLEESRDDKCERKRFALVQGKDELEKMAQLNKGFWTDRPEVIAPLIQKLKEKYTVDIKNKTKREHGIFYRPKFIELEYLKKMAKAGLLYPEEEFSEEEEEVQPENNKCVALRKIKYQICDPCKEKKVKKEKPPLEPPKDLIEDIRRRGLKPPFDKIPSGCQCDYFGDHNHPPTVWDNPFDDEVDMLRQHEMNKVLKPYKMELLNKNYEQHPPVQYLAQERGKKTFPVYQISNL